MGNNCGSILVYIICHLDPDRIIFMHNGYLHSSYSNMHVVLEYHTHPHYAESTHTLAHSNPNCGSQKLQIAEPNCTARELQMVPISRNPLILSNRRPQQVFSAGTTSTIERCAVVEYCT